jgi:hypothetical protein
VVSVMQVSTRAPVRSPSRFAGLPLRGTGAMLAAAANRRLRGVQTMTSSSHVLRRLAAGCAPLLLGVASSAFPATINLPAIAFQAPGTQGADEAVQGFLANQGTAAVYFGAVPDLPAGERVCRFVLYARDFDGEHGVTARLVRKRLAFPDGTGFGAPAEIMASVATSGFDADTQAVGTPQVTGRTVSRSYLYWAEIEFTGGFVEALAVRIVTTPDC